MRRLWILVILIGGLLLSACGTVAEPDTRLDAGAVVIDTATLERGIEVYRANYCGACHTLDVASTRGNFGPEHNQAYALAATNVALETYTGRAETVEAYLHESIVAPTVFYTPGYEATNHHMPAFAHLSEADIDALVYLLARQR